MARKFIILVCLVQALSVMADPLCPLGEIFLPKEKLAQLSHDETVALGEKQLKTLMEIMDGNYELEGIPVEKLKKVAADSRDFLKEHAHDGAVDWGNYVHTVEGHLADAMKDAEAFAQLYGIDVKEARVTLAARALAHDIGKMKAARPDESPLAQFLKSKFPEVPPNVDFNAFLKGIFGREVLPHEFFTNLWLIENREKLGLTDAETRDIIRSMSKHNYLLVDYRDANGPEKNNDWWPTQWKWFAGVTGLPEYYIGNPLTNDPAKLYLTRKDRARSLYEGPRKFFNEGGGKISVAGLQANLVTNPRAVAGQLATFDKNLLGPSLPKGKTIADVSWVQPDYDRAKVLEAIGNEIYDVMNSDAQRQQLGVGSRAESPNVVLYRAKSGVWYKLDASGKAGEPVLSARNAEGGWDEVPGNTFRSRWDSKNPTPADRFMTLVSNDRSIPL